MKPIIYSLLQEKNKNYDEYRNILIAADEKREDDTKKKIMELERRINKLESKPTVSFISVIVIVYAFVLGWHMVGLLF